MAGDSINTVSQSTPAPQKVRGKMPVPPDGKCLIGANFNNTAMEDQPWITTVVRPLEQKNIPVVSTAVSNAAEGLSWFNYNIFRPYVAKPVTDLSARIRSNTFPPEQGEEVFTEAAIRFNERMGKDASITFGYQAIYDPFHNKFKRFPMGFIMDAASVGMTPVVIWEASDMPLKSSMYFLDQFIEALKTRSGPLYEFMKNWAIDAAKDGGPMGVCPLPAPNTTVYYWRGYGNGADERKGFGDPSLADGSERYRYVFGGIKDLFVEYGATNVFFGVALEGRSLVKDADGRIIKAPWNKPANYINKEKADWIFFSGFRTGEKERFEDVFNDAIPYFEGRRGYNIENIPVGIFAFSSAPFKDKGEYLKKAYEYALTPTKEGKIKNIKVISFSNIDETYDFRLVSRPSELLNRGKKLSKPEADSVVLAAIDSVRVKVSNDHFIGVTSAPITDTNRIIKESLDSKQMRGVEGYISSALRVFQNNLYFRSQIGADKKFNVGSFEQQYLPVLHPRSTEYDDEFKLKSIGIYEDLGKYLNEAKITPELIESFRSEKKYLGFLRSAVGWAGMKAIEWVGGRLFDFKSIKEELDLKKFDMAKASPEELAAYGKQIRLIMNRNILMEAMTIPLRLDPGGEMYVRGLDKLKNFYFGWIERGLIYDNNFNLMTAAMIDAAMIRDALQANNLRDELKELDKIPRTTNKKFYEEFVKRGTQVLKEKHIDLRLFSEFMATFGIRVKGTDENFSTYLFDGWGKMEETPADFCSFTSAGWGICKMIQQLANDPSYGSAMIRTKIKEDERLGLLASSKELQSRLLLERYEANLKIHPQLQGDPRAKEIVLAESKKLLEEASCTLEKKQGLEVKEYALSSLIKGKSVSGKNDLYLVDHAFKAASHKLMTELWKRRIVRHPDFFLLRQMEFDRTMINCEMARLDKEISPADEVVKSNYEKERQKALRKYDEFLADKWLSPLFKNRVKRQMYQLLIDGSDAEKNRAKGIIFYKD